jgi:hypothetical protein
MVKRAELVRVASRQPSTLALAPAGVENHHVPLLLEGIDLEKGKYRPHFADGVRIAKSASENAERGRTPG